MANIEQIQVGDTTYDIAESGYAISEQYSTTEKVIGTWIDGKTVYQSVVTINNPSVTWGTFQSYGLDLNIHIIDISSRFEITSWWTEAFEYSNNEYIRIICQDKGFRLTKGSGVGTITKVVFIIKYTKTTT